MDRRLLFPIAAVTAWAQQPSPAPAEAEAALRAKVNEFFQLQVDKKFRQAEALVADDSKDNYYNGSRYNIKNFTIQRIEFQDGNTRANVTIKARVTLVMAGAPPVDLDAPSTTVWKMERGQWALQIAGASIRTPFGEIKSGQAAGSVPSSLDEKGKAPDISVLRTLVKIDRNSVELTPDGPSQVVTVSNDLPGGADLELSFHDIPGLSAQLDKKHLEGGEKTSISFRASAEGKGAGVVRLVVSPLAVQLDINVKID